MTDDDVKPCAACLKPLAFGKARLMYGKSGLFRLCKQRPGCVTRTEKRLQSLEVEFATAGGRGVELAEEIDNLRKFVGRRW